MHIQYRGAVSGKFRNQEKKLLIENGVWVYKQTRIHYTPPLSQGNRTRPLAPANVIYLTPHPNVRIYHEQ